MAKKKGFNPFKMWGSYVGAIVLTILPIFTNPIGRVFTDCNIANCTTSVWDFRSLIAPYVIGGIGFILVPATLIIGFIIGWGIHSIFRVAK